MPGYSSMPKLGTADRRHAARFGHTPSQVRAARRWARTVTGLPQEEADALELLLSELVTNALEHSASGQEGHFTVTLAYLDTNVIRLAVADAGPRHGEAPTVPRVRPVDPGLEHGRGLALVDRLSRRWGFLGVQGAPLTVWAVISRTALR
ncbi:ATP-binding protein [Nocardiopsis sp. Huas11]|uniref:ATP-binding protein n=1 Tax=Nocardiopsis sp. Huas11 TaxID=2183912 RepID=UPI001F34D42F|nr:ATP-binding protein [Nocardiopsis sp. Huas11]